MKPTSPFAAVLASTLAVVVAPALGQDCTQKATPLDGATAAEFGGAIDVQGTRAIVGAFHESSAAGFGGAVYVVEQNPATKAWLDVQKLVAPDAGSIDEFGTSLAFDGDLLVVGAPAHDANGSNSGAAYFFERDPLANTWSFVQKVIGADTVTIDQFGRSVSLDGERAIVGASFSDQSGLRQGTAYVFERDGQTGQWSESYQLTASDAANYDYFGHAVLLDGDRAFVSAADQDRGTLSTGSVYVYEFDGVTWNETQQLFASNAALADRFGFAMAVDGDVLLVGARERGAGNEGAVYVFERDAMTGDWLELQFIEPSNPTSGTEFGSAIAFDGVRALIGGPRDGGTGTRRGRVDLYERDAMTGLFSEVRVIRAFDEADDDRFGSAVALTAGSMLFGAPGEDQNGAASGAMYAEVMGAPDCDNSGMPDICEIASGLVNDGDGDWVPDPCEGISDAFCSPGVPNSTSFPSALYILGSDVAADNDVRLTVVNLPQATAGYFLVSAAIGFVPNPGGSAGNLCLAGAPIGRYAGDVLNTFGSDRVQFDVDLTDLPQPTGSVVVAPGETWCFQYWHRDSDNGMATSNFSDARCVLFL